MLEKAVPPYLTQVSGMPPPAASAPHRKRPAFRPGTPWEFKSAYGQHGMPAPQQATMTLQHEATALITVSGEAAKAAVPEASSSRPAMANVFFMFVSVRLRG